MPGAKRNFARQWRHQAVPAEPCRQSGVYLRIADLQPARLRDQGREAEMPGFKVHFTHAVFHTAKVERDLPATVAVRCLDVDGKALRQRALKIDRERIELACDPPTVIGDGNSDVLEAEKAQGALVELRLPARQQPG